MRERLPLPLRPHIPIFSPGWVVILMPRRISLPECVKDAERSLSSTCPVAGQSSVTDRVSQERFSLGVTSAKVFSRPYEDTSLKCCDYREEYLNGLTLALDFDIVAYQFVAM
jgi:hypothetical protein